MCVGCREVCVSRLRPRCNISGHLKILRIISGNMLCYQSTYLPGVVNNTTNTSVIKHALVPNGWVGGWLGGVVVGGGGGGGRGAKAKVHSTFWVVGGVGGVGWVVVVVVVGGRRQRCIVPSGW